MKVKIYQLPVEHERCFRGFDAGKRVPVEDYELVWEGELIARTLEKVYRELNYAHPADYKARSLSVSDIVEVIGENGKGDKAIVQQLLAIGVDVKAWEAEEIHLDKETGEVSFGGVNARRSNGALDNSGKRRLSS